MLLPLLLVYYDSRWVGGFTGSLTGLAAILLICANAVWHIRHKTLQRLNNMVGI